MSNNWSLRSPLPFPLGAPNWPASVPRPKKRSVLGVNYETEWARRYSVRLARVAWTEFVTRPLMMAVTQPTVEGLDRFEATTALLFSPPTMPATWMRPSSFLSCRSRGATELSLLAAADYFFDSRVKAAYFAFSLNAVPIDRVKVSRDSLKRAEALLADGWNLLVFPEGGRSPDGWGHAHTGGAAWLAARSGRPLVPVHIKGTGRLLPRGARRVYTGQTEVTFGAPITPDLPARQLVARLEDAIAALADEATSDWWSARRRAAKGATPPLTGPEAASWRRAWALGPSPKDSARRGSSEGEETLASQALSRQRYGLSAAFTSPLSFEDVRGCQRGGKPGPSATRLLPPGCAARGGEQWPYAGPGLSTLGGPGGPAARGGSSGPLRALDGRKKCRKVPSAQTQKSATATTGKDASSSSM